MELNGAGSSWYRCSSLTVEQGIVTSIASRETPFRDRLCHLTQSGVRASRG